MEHGMNFENLSPTQFEQMTYDLLVAMGFKNVSWLGGPADAGRDIEAHLPQEDPDGRLRLERWAVQCKRYAKRTSSEVVREAVGASLGYPVDVFLLVVSARLTASAKRQLEATNQGSKTRFKVWERHDLISLLEQHPQVAAKYFPATPPTEITPRLSHRLLVVDDAIATGSSLKRIIESTKGVRDSIALARPKDLDYASLDSFKEFATQKGFSLMVLDIDWAAKLGKPTVPRKDLLERIGDLSEDEFTFNVLVPLFEKMRFARVRVVHSARERGLDILLEEKTPFGYSHWVGIQAKAAKIHASRGKHDEGLVYTVALQLRDAFQMQHEVDDDLVTISRCILVTSKSISSEARQALLDSFEQRIYKANIRIMDGQDVVGLASQVGLVLDFL
jgi:HJR/Mrr/RecB family endonuclease